MYNVNLENQNRDQSDAVLAPSLGQTDQSSLAGAPRPQSSGGQEIFSAVSQTLLCNEDDDGLDAVLIEADADSTPASKAGKTLCRRVECALLRDVEDGHIQAGILKSSLELETYFGRIISTALADQPFNIYEEIEQILLSQIIYVLESGVVELEEQIFDQTELSLIENGATWLDIHEGNEGILELMAKIKIMLPKLVQNSVSWKIDTARINDRLSTIIRDFICDVFLPAMADKTCRSEVELGLVSTAVPSLNAEHGNINQTSGAYHG